MTCLCVKTEVAECCEYHYDNDVNTDTNTVGCPCYNVVLTYFIGRFTLYT